MLCEVLVADIMPDLLEGTLSFASVIPHGLNLNVVFQICTQRQSSTFISLCQILLQLKVGQYFSRETIRPKHFSSALASVCTVFACGGYLLNHLPRIKSAGVTMK